MQARLNNYQENKVRSMYKGLEGLGATNDGMTIPAPPIFTSQTSGVPDLVVKQLFEGYNPYSGLLSMSNAQYAATSFVKSNWMWLAVGVLAGVAMLGTRRR